MGGFKKRIYLYLCILLSVLCLGLFAVEHSSKKVGAEESATFQMADGVAYRNCWSESHCGLTYSATLNKAYCDNFVSTNAVTHDVSVNLLVVPYSYVTSLAQTTVSKYATAKASILSGDYVKAFEQATTAGASFWYGVVDHIYDLDGLATDGTVQLRGGLKTIQVENMNRRYFGVYYLEGKKADETVVRVYAKSGNDTSTAVEKAARTANSFAYVVSSLDTENRNEWETANMTTFLKRSVEGALKASVSSDDNAKFSLEQFNAKGVNDLVKAEIEDITYGDDIFGVKLYGALVEASGTSIFKEVTGKLDFNLKWDFDELSGIDLTNSAKNEITVQQVKSADDTKATLTIGGNISTIDFNVKQLSVSDASSIISVDDYEAVREENIDEVKSTVRAEVTYAPSDKRLTEKTFTFTPTCSGSGFCEYTATVSQNDNFSGETSTTFNIIQKKFNITKGTISHGDITLSTTQSVCDEQITLGKNPDSNYVFVNYVVDGVSQTEDSFIMPDKDIIVLATFEGRNCVITYYTDDGVSTTQNVKYDESYSMKNASKSGYTFAGWSDDQNESAEWSSGTKTCQGEKDYYAVWQKTWSFYDTASSTVTQNVNYAYNGAGTTYAKTNPTLSGYSFQGYSNTNATAATVAAGSSSTTVTNSTDTNAKFYAVWLKSGFTENKTEKTTGSGGTATITYYGNGSTSGSTTSTTATITINYDEVYQRSYSQRYNYSLSSNGGQINVGAWSLVSKTETGRTRSAILGDNGFNRTGYNFTKWAAGSPSGTQYSIRDNYTGTATIFYAVWSPIPYNVKVNYYLNYGAAQNSISNVAVELDVNGSSIGSKSTYNTTLGYDSTIGIRGFTDGGYAVQYYKINGEYYSIYQSASSADYRVKITGDTTLEVYLSTSSGMETVISNKYVNRKGIKKSGDDVAGFDIGGVRKINGDFYMEMHITDLVGSQSNSTATWNDFIWATFILGMYDTSNVSRYRFVRLDNWSWTTTNPPCGVWVNEVTNGSRDTSNWWQGLNDATVRSAYDTGIALDIRMTKVGTNMYLIYHIYCANTNKYYRQYYKFTNLPSSMNIFLSSEDASFKIDTLKIRSSANYAVYQPINVDYGVGNGWNDWNNLYDITNVEGNFTFNATFTMDAMRNGAAFSGTAQVDVYKMGDTTCRLVGRYDWYVSNEKSFSSSLNVGANNNWCCDGIRDLLKCGGTDGKTISSSYGRINNNLATLQSIADYSYCEVEVTRRNDSVITITMRVRPSNGTQWYGLWYTVNDCYNGAVGIRIAEESTLYTMTSFSLY